MRELRVRKGLLHGIASVFFVAGLVTTALMVQGCGLDETYTGTGVGALPGEPLNPIPVEATIDGDAVCQCNCTGGGSGGDLIAQVNDVVVADLSGRGYRIDSLVVTGPFKGLVADTLNDYFTTEIEANGLNVLFLVTTDNRDEGIVIFTLGAGEVDGDGYKFLPDPGSLNCTLNGDLLATAEPTELFIPNAALDPAELPVSKLEVTARLDLEGTVFTKGKLVGALTAENAAATKILGVPLNDFLAQSDIEPDLDLDNNGSPESWKFTFDFTAVEESVTK